MTLEEFRKRHGAEYASITSSAAFKAAVATIEENSPILHVVDRSEAEVKAYGEILLAKQQGFLVYSRALQKLHIQPQNLMDELGPEQYQEDDPTDDIKPKTRKKRNANT